MPIEFGHIIEGHVFYSRGIGLVTSREYSASVEHARQIIERSSHTSVHVIIDAHDMIKGPDVTSLTRHEWHPKTGWVIVVGLKNPAIRILSQTASQILRLRLQFADDLTKGLKFLQDIDESLRRFDLSEPQVTLITSFDETYTG